MQIASPRSAADFDNPVTFEDKTIEQVEVAGVCSPVVPTCDDRGLFDWEVVMPSDAKVRAMRDALVKWGKLNAEELSEISIFHGYRNGAELRIEIHDLGEGSVANGAYRFNAVVTDVGSGSLVRGNGGASIEEALAIVHWNELDG